MSACTIPTTRTTSKPNSARAVPTTSKPSSARAVPTTLKPSSARAIPTTSKPNSARAIPTTGPRSISTPEPNKALQYTHLKVHIHFLISLLSSPRKAHRCIIMGRIRPQISHHKALSKCPRHFHHKPFENPYQAQPQVGPFPPKSPINGIPVAPSESTTAGMDDWDI
ncbi:hypothetical protein OIU74_023900 [Salix koriyanagi]|uniref:Uncharacterized protein n=1 Tax=Salix koriyanagi TaxID=2511006 RepID=A0A9Q1ABK8_9ROSI|nr:hypothetical protein OIU74_023900 [Salix koriyanagi]